MKLFGMSLLVEAVYAIVLCFAILRFPGRHNTLQAFDGILLRSPPWSLCLYDSVEFISAWQVQDDPFQLKLLFASDA